VNHAFNPLYKKSATSFPNIELLFRIDDVGMLPRMLQALGYTIAPDVDVFNEYTGILPQGTNQLMLEASKTAYVPISTGCSQFCAYCIVPYSRGLEKNRPVAEIHAEVRHHLDHGVQEIVLLGQIVNKHPDFVQIVKDVLAMPGLVRLRYTSPYPTYYSPELLHLHETEEKLCPHIHIPLQS
jgi:tRNA-2-methylthio-N6-dimethylallyladenosine synthase